MITNPTEDNIYQNGILDHETTHNNRSAGSEGTGDFLRRDAGVISQSMVREYPRVIVKRHIDKGREIPDQSFQLLKPMVTM